MRNRYPIFIILFLINITIYGQHGVSGYVNIEHPEKWEQNVHLSQVHFEENTETYTATTIASVPMTKEGFFAFDQNLFTSKNRIYKIHINPISTEERAIISNKIKNYKLFILSKNDSIYFNKGQNVFGDYKTTSNANLEWQKLKKFEARYENLTNDFDPKQYLLETKGYVKDSLQILLVKLIGIKKLDDQNLLEKDIRANPKYYLDFLKELKSSDIDPNFYLYLENKLTFVTKEITTKKYNFSLWINAIAVFIIVLLVFYIFKYQNRLRKNATKSALSKQEEKIRDLIVSGKSNKEIANELFISLSTVKTHITNIYSKLNISTRKELLLKK
ncbi:hypothetical protein GCM10022259_12310 [Aquimarina mytili]